MDPRVVVADKIQKLRSLKDAMQELKGNGFLQDETTIEAGVTSNGKASLVQCGKGGKENAINSKGCKDGKDQGKESSGIAARANDGAGTPTDGRSDNEPIGPYSQPVFDKGGQDGKATGKVGAGCSSKAAPSKAAPSKAPPKAASGASWDYRDGKGSKGYGRY
jgi:hypothetical protein